MEYIFPLFAACVAATTSLAAAPVTSSANELTHSAATVSASAPNSTAEDQSVFKRKKRKVSPAYRRTIRRRR